jgi:Na+-translocating ferredoxin:NAD+ oxidoreductase RnfD subunit
MKKVLDNNYFVIHCNFFKRKDSQMERIMTDMSVALMPIFEEYSELEIMAALEQIKLTIFFAKMLEHKNVTQ